MGNKNSKTAQGKNLLPTIKEPDQADNLWIGGEGQLRQWSVSQEEVTKEYDDIMPGYILSMVQTSDKNYLFVSDQDGH